jgi:hypothetical protein
LSGRDKPTGISSFFDYTPYNHIYEAVFNDYTIFLFFTLFSCTVVLSRDSVEFGYFFAEQKTTTALFICSEQSRSVVSISSSLQTKKHPT